MEIPQEVKKVLKKLTDTGREAFIVGGSVRHLLIGEEPYDWDIATDATPDEIQKLFPDSFYENEFGTVGVKTGSEAESLAIVEITTYRLESKYTDKRHPDEVRFTNKLQDDLKRRDLTINAIAMDALGAIIDPFGGQEDLKNKIIKAVGDPNERFGEDALRMMRAIRLAVTLGFEVEPSTLAALSKNHELLKAISKERIRDELVLIINSSQADRGFEMLCETGLLKYILPELLEGVDVGQNKHHIYTVWEHNLRALKYACDKNYSLEVRTASLLHDVGKPRTKRGEGLDSTFYGHEVVGAHMAAEALDRLRFPKDQAEKIFKLVRYHLFYYNVGEVTESSVRRLVANIGKENVEDLIKVREADRIGSGVPKAKPYKLRHLQFMIDKVSRDPISPKMLKIKGDDIMSILGLPPGPKVGLIIHSLMNEVLDDPDKNSSEYLERRAKEFNRMTEVQLVKLGKTGKIKMSEEEHKEVDKIKEKYFVK
ncbi:MAG: HD domain-containing protein [Candidatus Yanofskybacteria bacterium]|nr:HD domain-containing protein [Candidatus Yanofskybacteria bacterium]